MKAKEINVGSKYLMKVSNQIQVVRVDFISSYTDYKGKKKETYDCTNLATGRKCKAHSASKFRCAVTEEPTAQVEGKDWLNCGFFSVPAHKD